MTLSQALPAGWVADAQQAAYFRDELIARRRLLLDGPPGGRRPADANGDPRSEALSTESDVQQIDRMLENIDSRFRALWSYLS